MKYVWAIIIWIGAFIPLVFLEGLMIMLGWNYGICTAIPSVSQISYWGAWFIALFFEAIHQCFKDIHVKMD